MNKHLLRIQKLNVKDIHDLLDLAETFLQRLKTHHPLPTPLSSKIVVNFFFEPSTRTRQSFTIAAQRLGAMVLNPAMEQSSAVKGESLKDTLQTYIAMGCQIFIIRSAQNFLAEEAADLINHHPVSVINAGDGNHQHPTQTLLDLLTIRQCKSTFSGLRVAIMGDILHSRVAGSLIPGLQLMGVTDIRLLAPESMLPKNLDALKVNAFADIKAGMADADVIITLRIQRERMLDEEIPDNAAFHQQYGLTQKLLLLAKPDAIVMHPGPLNRGVEISSEVADGPQSVILQQVSNGIAIRMAVLEWLQQQ